MLNERSPTVTEAEAGNRPSRRRIVGALLALSATLLMGLAGPPSAGPPGAIGPTAYSAHGRGDANSSMALGNVSDDKLPAPSSARGAAQGSFPAAVVQAGQLAIPILMYHFVRVADAQHDPLGFRLSVRPGDFASQMDWLQGHGGTTISLAELLGALHGQFRLPPHPVILTFDDGYADFATTVVPVLADHGFTAIDFVPAGLLNHPEYMTTTQVRAAVSAGMIIGAHTVHHVDLTTVPRTVAQMEITVSRQLLQQITDQPVLDFAYPSGRYTPELAQMVGAAGFRDAVTTRPGVVHSLAQALTLSRIRVGGGETLADFVRNLNAGTHPA